MHSRCLTVLLLLAGAASAGEHPVLRMKSLGIVNRETEPAGRRINDLCWFDGKLWIGTGDYTVNTGPMDILAVDPATGRISVEGRVDDEAIAVFRVVDGRLVIPGTDATESWDYGNVYVRAKDGGWTKHRSVPRGLHVFDVTSWRGRWWAATGTFIEPAPGQQIGCGAVLSSGDEGATWQSEILAKADRNGFARCGWLAVYGDRLYGFPYALAEVSTTEVPPEYRVSDAPTHLMFLPDLYGAADAIATDGGPWKPVDLVPVPNVIKVSPIPFGDRLVLSVVTGEHVPSWADTYYRDRRLPKGAAARLFVFDGKRTKPVDLPHDLLLDACVADGRLGLLVLRGGRSLIATTRDLKKWNVVEPAIGIGNALSILRVGGTWYVGMKDGNLLASTGTAPAGTPAEPSGYEILAALPRDGQGAWAAIVSTVDPTVRGRLAVRRQGARIEAETANLDEFLVFAGDLGLSGRVTFVVDGRETTLEEVGGRTALVATRVDGGFVIATEQGSAATFTPTPRVVATAAAALTRDGGDPTIGLVVVDAIRAAAGTDVALMNRGTIRRDLPAGPIHDEDVFDLVYRNRIATFRAKGGVLREMIAHNLATAGRDVSQFAGFTATWSAKDGLEDCSLAPDREYLVALPDYTAENAERYYGRAVAFERSDTYVHHALLAWLRAHPVIGEVPARLTRRE